MCTERTQNLMLVYLAAENWIYLSDIVEFLRERRTSYEL